jgi:hypothetical protein
VILPSWIHTQPRLVATAAKPGLFQSFTVPIVEAQPASLPEERKRAKPLPDLPSVTLEPVPGRHPLRRTASTSHHTRKHNLCSSLFLSTDDLSMTSPLTWLSTLNSNRNLARKMASISFHMSCLRSDRDGVEQFTRSPRSAKCLTSDYKQSDNSDFKQLLAFEKNP